ncbi:helicase-exonuclease AddAB subunit AddB (plasmid) [Rossellomorea sp. AcN35-11]|nr:helicase-exonuclease AddAB subunit AddB [Rossellomorea sp. AcN35-11]
MSLRFIRGRAGSGKTTYILNEVQSELIGKPEGHPLYLLVPDQMSFELEYELINTKGLRGMIRTQVFSFSRLAWRVLQETGGISRYHVKGVGIHMLLRKIVEEKKKELLVYKKAADQSGFIDQLEEVISEFKRYCVGLGTINMKIEELNILEDRSPGEEVLLRKLKDLELILCDYEESLVSKYIDEEDFLRLLSEKISHSEALKDAEIYIDGFHSFTPQELMVIHELIQHCRRVTISMKVDQNYEENLPDELSLFYMNGKTYFEIYQAAISYGIEFEPAVDMNVGSFPRFLNSPSLRHLEENFDVRPAVPFKGNSDVKVVTAVNRRAEVEGVARSIVKKVREEGYSWRDCVVLLRENNAYQDLIETLFEDYNIPVYQDQKRSMLNHPVVELIRSSLEIVRTNWRYDPVFRAFKTGLIGPIEVDGRKTVELLDKMENYVIANGIKGLKKWRSEEDWKLMNKGEYLRSYETHHDFEHALNSLRRELVSHLDTFGENLKETGTVVEMAEVLFVFLETLEVPKKIEVLKQKAEENDDLVVAREHDQVWSNIVELLDQMVELMGKEEVSLDLFIRLLETGLEELKFALVPPAIDQVLVGNIELSRFLNCKNAYLLGVNEGVLPSKPIESSVITEKERELLTNTGMQLAPGSMRRIIDESFLVYLGLTSSSDSLWISYPMANEEGKSLMPSIVINQVKDLFPDIKEELILNDPFEEDEKTQIGFITNRKKALSFLSSQLQQWKRGYPISDLWWSVYNWFVVNDKFALDIALRGLFHSNQAKKLSASTSEELYGKSIQASVSRLEKYHSCSFSHFASYGLGLKEREVYQLQAPDVGTLFHEALSRFGEQIRNKGMRWDDLSLKECEQLTFNIINELAPTIQNNILLSTDRFKYIKNRLTIVVQKAVNVMRDHSKVSEYVPVGLELEFGKKKFYLAFVGVSFK